MNNETWTYRNTGPQAPEDAMTPADRGILAAKAEARELDSLTHGAYYEVKDHPFRQVRKHFVAHYAGVIADCVTFITVGNEVIRFSDWDFNEAMTYGEITIIER